MKVYAVFENGNYPILVRIFSNEAAAKKYFDSWHNPPYTVLYIEEQEMADDYTLFGNLGDL